jgi:hypothetical protein
LRQLCKQYYKRYNLPPPSLPSSPWRHGRRAEILLFLFLTLALGGGDFIVKITLEQAMRSRGEYIIAALFL